jgi:hypothetical protein
MQSPGDRGGHSTKKHYLLIISNIKYFMTYSENPVYGLVNQAFLKVYTAQEQALKVSYIEFPDKIFSRSGSDACIHEQIDKNKK